MGGHIYDTAGDIGPKCTDFIYFAGILSIIIVFWNVLRQSSLTMRQLKSILVFCILLSSTDRLSNFNNIFIGCSHGRTGCG